MFPSVREFGGGVVFEALAMGAVPIVADFGGPGDIVHPEVGFKVPLTDEEDVVLQIEKILAKLVNNRKSFSNGCANKACAMRENV